MEPPIFQSFWQAGDSSMASTLQVTRKTTHHWVNFLSACFNDLAWKQTALGLEQEQSQA